MYPVSDVFRREIRRSHRALVKAEVWRGDSRILDLDLLDGSVEVDARRGVRRTCTLTVAAPDPLIVLDRGRQSYAAMTVTYSTYALLSASTTTYADIQWTDDEVQTEVDAGVVPDSSLSALAPYGNEVRLWRGLKVEREVADNYADLGADYTDYADLGDSFDSYGSLGQGHTVDLVDDLIPLGVFLITRVDVNVNDGGTTVSIAGSDRSLRVSRARWTEPYTASGNVATAIQALLEDRWADVICEFTSTDRTVSRAVLGLETSNDPWADAVNIATAAGMDLYFDGDGIARLEPVRDYDGVTPDAVYLENSEAMVLTLTRRLSNEQTYNGVIAVGEGSESSVTYRGEAWDEDLDSPTYRYGPFGEVPMFYSSSLLTSDDLARQTAEAMLARKRGTTEAVEWTQVVDPSLDVGDVIQVRNADAKVDRVMVLDRLQIPLTVTEPLTAVARTIRSLGGTVFEE